MGTKNRPGKYDCYENAEPDEPMFILLGRDPLAPLVVEFWARLRESAGDDPNKVSEATRCATRMERWLQKLERRPPTAAEMEAFLRGESLPPLDVLKGRIPTD